MSELEQSLIGLNDIKKEFIWSLTEEIVWNTEQLVPQS